MLGGPLRQEEREAQLSPVKSMLPQARVSVKIWGKIDPA